MKINEIIKERRKELKLTQENIAKQLGVSTLAVNKWEKGISYPDITILPNLARLLKTDLNTLLSFNRDLSDQEIAEIINKLALMIQDKGFIDGYQFVMDKIREYPNCDRLIYSIASSLEGFLLMSDVNHSKEYYEEIYSLYERVINSNDIEIKNLTLSKIILKYTKQGNYSKAQELIDAIPKQVVDKKQLQASLFIKQGKYKKSLEILEGTLLSKVSEIQLILLELMKVNIKLDKISYAEYIANTYSQTAKLYNLWEYNSYIASFVLAIFKKDKDKTIELLKDMFEAVSSKWNINDSPLYKNIRTKSQDLKMEELLISSLIKETRENKDFDFLRDDGEYLKLIEQFEKQASHYLT